ncbi:phenylalanine--tRNA ligase subunit beta [Dellaglioa sp. P0083]|uniref:phenylalanine--tRNA ligase subunit beta n=1 Tax=Dellaglioa kimchii TaxID=3344667 RepID=UPI0038D428EA
MKVSKNWLNEYLTLEIEPEIIAEKIARTAVEIDSVERPSEGLKKIVVGYVDSLVPHPDSDHLNICQVDVGEESLIQIVCGAPNIAAGQKVIVALPNSRIADNVKIKRGKMRGQASEGMICALQEIGFSDSVVPKEFVEGIYVMPENAIPGESVFDYLGMNDDIIDIDVTPNRADMLSMRGVAHELSADYDVPATFKHPELKETSTEKIEDYISLSLPDKTLAPTYSMRVIKDLTIKASPMWLQIRLWNAGVRPINNVVDVTNYILMDYGQPLHAFDYNKLGSKDILVRTANAGEKITTLDSEERELKEKDIVITNGKTPIAIAGTMGGESTQITDETVTVAIESAVFNNSMVRKTARTQGIHSEASMRFERGINVETVQEALDAAAELIANLGDGTVVSGTASASKLEAESTFVDTTVAHINGVLGTELSESEITKLFKQLGFTVVNRDGTLNVEVPARRWDISIEADLVEEIARIYGYDNIPSTLPTGKMTPGKYTYKQKTIKQARHILESAGLSEVISYGLTTEEKAGKFIFEEKDVFTTNLMFPMSSERTTTRMNLISGLLDDLAYNEARKSDNLAFYEQGRVFFRSEGEDRPTEIEHIAGAMTGLFKLANWQNEKQPVDFYMIKGVVEQLLTQLELVDDVRYVSSESHEDMHPGRTADIYLKDELIGFVGQVHPNAAKEFNLKETYVFELDLQKLVDAKKADRLFAPISKFPSVTRDVALVVANDIANSEIEALIKKQGGKSLIDVHLFDLYQGSHIENGMKSLAYTLTYQDITKTLVEEDVTNDFNRVIEALKETLRADIR